MKKLKEKDTHKLFTRTDNGELKFKKTCSRKNPETKLDIKTQEIQKLATYILEYFPDEPGKETSESAVEVAIRLLDNLRVVYENKK